MILIIIMIIIKKMIVIKILDWTFAHLDVSYSEPREFLRAFFFFFVKFHLPLKS